jgi:hypothetical protein
VRWCGVGALLLLLEFDKGAATEKEEELSDDFGFGATGGGARLGSAMSRGGITCCNDTLRTFPNVDGGLLESLGSAVSMSSVLLEFP